MPARNLTEIVGRSRLVAPTRAQISEAKLKLRMDPHFKPSGIPRTHFAHACMRCGKPVRWSLALCSHCSALRGGSHPISADRRMPGSEQQRLNARHAVLPGKSISAAALKERKAKPSPRAALESLFGEHGNRRITRRSVHHF